jgi:hypothetical protein
MERALNIGLFSCRPVSELKDSQAAMGNFIGATPVRRCKVRLKKHSKKQYKKLISICGGVWRHHNNERGIFLSGEREILELSVADARTRVTQSSRHSEDSK